MSLISTRCKIISAADHLFYQQGFEHTSFADISDAVKISRGNFYYHFKSKDNILDAVIDHRIARTRNMLDTWADTGQTPDERISCFIKILMANQAKIIEYGCPVGTLTTELAKLNHAAHGTATQVFTLFRDWLGDQFTQMGRAADADALAMHLLARSQGAATIASAYSDAGFLKTEVSQMCDWVASLLPN